MTEFRSVNETSDSSLFITIMEATSSCYFSTVVGIDFGTGGYAVSIGHKESTWIIDQETNQHGTVRKNWLLLSLISLLPSNHTIVLLYWAGPSSIRIGMQRAISSSMSWDITPSLNLLIFHPMSGQVSCCSRARRCRSITSMT